MNTVVKQYNIINKVETSERQSEHDHCRPIITIRKLIDWRHQIKQFQRIVSQLQLCVLRIFFYNN